jgi:hypothetical protein
VLYSLHDLVAETMPCKDLLLAKLCTFDKDGGYVFSLVSKRITCDRHLYEDHMKVIVHNSPKTWCSLH